jgi:hypothetical protein
LAGGQYSPASYFLQTSPKLDGIVGQLRRDDFDGYLTTSTYKTAAKKPSQRLIAGEASC